MMDETKSYTKKDIAEGSFFLNSISITSESGVGSSSTLQSLKVILGNSWHYVSGGDAMRKLAVEKGESIDECIKRITFEETEDEDTDVDNYLAEQGKENNMVLEARLAHIHTPGAFHVLLTCPYRTRTDRRVRQLQKKESRIINMGERNAIQTDLENRDERDWRRYEKKYPGCKWSVEDFDCVIATDVYDSPEKVVTHLLKEYEVWKKVTRPDRFISLEDSERSILEI